VPRQTATTKIFSSLTTERDWKLACQQTSLITTPSQSTCLLRGAGTVDGNALVDEMLSHFYPK
jgi:hypothetical protein